VAARNHGFGTAFECAYHGSSLTGGTAFQVSAALRADRCIRRVERSAEGALDIRAFLGLLKLRLILDQFLVFCLVEDYVCWLGGSTGLAYLLWSGVFNTALGAVPFKPDIT
jgi:hypothetical protein